MKINTYEKEIYFEEIAGIGELYLDFVILEYECPILFVCTNKNNIRYLCLCNEVREIQEWIISPITNEILIDMLSGNISIYQAFEKSDENKVLAILEFGDDIEQSRCVKFNDINPLDLPKKSRYLDRTGTIDRYIEMLNTQSYYTIDININELFQCDKELMINYLDFYKNNYKQGYNDIFRDSMVDKIKIQTRDYLGSFIPKNNTILGCSSYDVHKAKNQSEAA